MNTTMSLTPESKKIRKQTKSMRSAPPAPLKKKIQLQDQMFVKKIEFGSEKLHLMPLQIKQVFEQIARGTINLTEIDYQHLQKCTEDAIVNVRKLSLHQESETEKILLEIGQERNNQDNMKIFKNLQNKISCSINYAEEKIENCSINELIKNQSDDTQYTNGIQESQDIYQNLFSDQQFDFLPRLSKHISVDQIQNLINEHHENDDKFDIQSQIKELIPQDYHQYNNNNISRPSTILDLDFEMQF